MAFAEWLVQPAFADFLLARAVLRSADDIHGQLMSKFIIALILVAALLVSGLVSLLRNRGQPMGSPEVLERAKLRNRELDAQEKREEER